MSLECFLIEGFVYSRGGQGSSNNLNPEPNSSPTPSGSGIPGGQGNGSGGLLHGHQGGSNSETRLEDVPASDRSTHQHLQAQHHTNLQHKMYACSQELADGNPTSITQAKNDLDQAMLAHHHSYGARFQLRGSAVSELGFKRSLEVFDPAISKETLELYSAAFKLINECKKALEE